LNAEGHPSVPGGGVGVLFLGEADEHIRRQSRSKKEIEKGRRRSVSGRDGGEAGGRRKLKLV